ncbi:DMT family transporter [Novosphingobium sp. MW5]|nr:DMT family transporter [Novosphingobium sp. MW5]
MPPLSAAFGQVSCAALMLLPVVLVVDQPRTSADARLAGFWRRWWGWRCCRRPWPISRTSGLIASAGAVNAFLVTFLIPVSAIALGVLVLGETLLARQVAGMALIALGLAAVIDGRTWRRLRKARGCAPPAPSYIKAGGHAPLETPWIFRDR